MPKTQTLNLYFDPLAATGQDGKFAADTMAHRSEVWIDDKGTSIPDKLLVVKFKDAVSIGIQIGTELPANWHYVDLGGTCLRVTAVAWRNHSSTKPNDAKHDSPFTHNNQPGGRELTVFDQPFTAAQLVNGSASLSLGQPQLNSGAPHGHDRYIYLIAVTLNLVDDLGAPRTFTAGRDPQMDVDL
jgi:hypothetical protein